MGNNKEDLVKLSQAAIRKVIVDLHYEGKQIYEISNLLNLPEAYVVDVLERGGYVVK